VSASGHIQARNEIGEGAQLPGIHTKEGESWATTIACFSARRAHRFYMIVLTRLQDKYTTMSE